MGESAKRCAGRAYGRGPGRRRIQGVNGAAAFFRRLQFRNGVGTSQFVYGELLGLTMKCQLEPLDEKRLKHRTFHLLNCSIALSFGLNVETIGTNPGWASGNLVIGDAVSKNDQRPRSEV